jgi:hypothetical protein
MKETSQEVRDAIQAIAALKDTTESRLFVHPTTPEILEIRDYIRKTHRVVDLYPYKWDGSSLGVRVSDAELIEFGALCAAIVVVTLCILMFATIFTLV